MEYYLIKSLKWTKCDKVETWWGPNENGYTTYICNAGIYTEEDTKEPPLKNENGKSLLFIPLTQELIEKGKQQLKKAINRSNEELIRIKDNYETDLKSVNKHIELIKSKDIEMLKMKELIKGDAVD